MIQNIVKVTAATVQQSRARWTWTNEIKKHVMGSQPKEIQCLSIYWTKEQNLGYAAGTTAALCLPAFLLGPLSWFPGSPGASWLPDLRVLLWVLLRIWRFLEFIVNSAQQQPVRFRVIFSLYIEFISQHGALHSVHNSLYMHLAKEQASPVRQIFFCGAMAPTLLPVRPGPHLTDVSVSLSLSLSQENRFPGRRSTERQSV